MELNRYIDGAFLKPDWSYNHLIDYIELAEEYKIRGVCVLPNRIIEARDLVTSRFQDPRIIGCLNFPFGSNINSIIESSIMSNAGINEIDYVVPLGILKDLSEDNRFFVSKFGWLEREILPIRSHVSIFKLIIEISLLTERMLKVAIDLAKHCNVSYIKTSTGVINTRPTTVGDIKKIRSMTDIPIKASGGIKTREQALELIDAGASIIGVSDFKKILEGE